MTTATATLTRSEELGRRVRAARILGGFYRRIDFIEATGGALAARSLEKIENGERQRLSLLEMDTIASTCGVPVEFFTFDLDSLTQASVVERLEAVEGKLAAVLAELRRDAERAS